VVVTKEKIFNASQIAELLAYHLTDDDRTDTRKTVRIKHPRWNIDKWPQHIVATLIDAIAPLIDANAFVEQVLFIESTISFQVHVDSGYSNSRVHKGILIPLQCEHGSTVFFNNYWSNDAAKFVRGEDPSGHEKEPTEQFIQKKHERVTDYTKIENYTDKPFDLELYNTYLTHVPYENLHGLTVDKIVKWSPGDIIIFDRNQLHCASNEHDHKIGITVFTTLEE